MAVLLAVLLLAVGALSVVVIVNRSNIGAVTAAGVQQRREIRSDEQRLAYAQFVNAVSQKASTKARIATVRQRCNLTGLILRVLLRVSDKVDATPFHASEATCMKQLADVKAIDAATPVPKYP